MAPIDTVLTGGMEMELNQIILLLANRNRVVMRLWTRSPINLDSMAIEMGNGILDGFVVKGKSLLGTVDESREGFLVDVDGGLLHAGFTGYVGGIEKAPVVWSGLITAVLFLWFFFVVLRGEVGRGR